jgi:hypothetical protein
MAMENVDSQHSFLGIEEGKKKEEEQPRQHPHGGLVESEVHEAPIDEALSENRHESENGSPNVVEEGGGAETEAEAEAEVEEK